MKICNKCKIERSFDCFYQSSRFPCGHVGICKSCSVKATRASQNKKPDEMRARNHKSNGARIASGKAQAENRIWCEANRDKEIGYRRASYVKRKESGAIAAYQRNLFMNDVQYRLACLLRSRLRYALATQKATKSSALDLLGCSVLELRGYLESQFAPEMNWENQGQWHVDHKIPCAKFDLADPEQQKTCFHFTNLQPLWAVDNLRKGTK